MMRCPVSLSCRWHDRVASWLRMGQLQKLKEHADVLHVLIGRAWRPCTCGLRAKIKAAL